MNFIKGIFEIAPAEFSYDKAALASVILLIIGAVVFSQIYKKKKKEDIAFKKLFKKTSSHLVSFAIAFSFLVAVRYEEIIYFSMRLWLYLTVLGFIYWLYRTIKKYKVDYPKEQAKHNKKTENKKGKIYSTKKK